MGTEGDTVRVIAGRYRLEKRLGRGGMGVVWKASDQLLGRLVAVKELTLDEMLSEQEARGRRDRTLREARAVAQLRHPHVVVVHDVVEHDERLYIVMELIEGGSLSDRLHAGGPVDAREAARIALALLGALGTAHAAGVLHRDLKPANVLMEVATGRVVLTDFGIAHVNGATTLTETGSFVGSPEYTAPERMSGGGTGPECDLWSLGTLLCALLSGESPFRRDSLGGVLHAVVFDEIRPPAQAEPLLPVVQGLLERDPEHRLSAADAERMLRSFLDTGTTPPYTPQSAAPGHAATERNATRQSAPVPVKQQSARPGRSMLIAAALVAAIAGAGVSAAALLFDGSTDVPWASGSQASHAAPAGGSATGTPGSPTASATAASRTPSGSTGVPVPSGYRRAEDPEGFTLTVPEGYTRVVEGERIFYLSPGSVFRIGIKETGTEPGGPLGVMHRADAKAPTTNPGYKDGTVTATTHGEHPAALWEFTWGGWSQAEGPRHSFDLCWEENGRMWDVWVSAPVARTQEARTHFDAVAANFEVKS